MTDHLTRRAVLALPALGVLPLWAKPKTPALPLVLAQAWRGGDVSQYWVSEKLDGVRAYWDGKALMFRSGLPIAAPAWFTAKLPARPLDGELWLARGQFDALSGTVRKAVPIDAEWLRLRYMVFELPNARGNFTERSEALKRLIGQTAWQQLQWVEQFRLKDAAALQAKLVEVTKAGGEGLMLHEANAPFVAGRSPVLQKLKPVADADAQVLAHVPGKGKHSGSTGALLVRTEDGISFKLGTGLDDATRQNPPPVGAWVTFNYRDTTPSGKPRFASFVRVRELP